MIVGGGIAECLLPEHPLAPAHTPAHYRCTPLQVNGEWQTEPGTIPFCGALSALPSDAVQAESSMHKYAPRTSMVSELHSSTWMATQHKSTLATSCNQHYSYDLLHLLTSGAA